MWARLAERPDVPVIAVHRALVVDVVCPEGECVHHVVFCPGCAMVIHTDDDGCCDAPDRAVDALGCAGWTDGR